MKNEFLKTEIVKINNPDESKTAIEKAADILRAGGLVVFPTETVYGLGANACDGGAAAKIYAAKGRPSDNPLIVHIANPGDAEGYAVTNEYYYKLARAFMPGPLTVILPKKDTIPLEVTGGLDTVAVRCPSHPTARALIEATGFPIAAPSANISGRPSPTTAGHVIEDLFGRVDMIIDGGDCEVGLESTIVALRDDEAVLLRPGAVTAEQLRSICGRLTLSAAVSGELPAGETVLSPGTKYKHYAPTSPLILLDGTETAFIEFIKEKRRTQNCAVICSQNEAALLGGNNLIITGESGNLTEQARRIFGALREADKLGCEIIYARLPSRDGLGLALYNRMIRAASHTVLSI